MSVVKSKRGTTKLEVAIKARNLIKHMLVITKNEKIFNPTYSALTEDLIHTAEQIYVDIYKANTIYAKGKDNFEERIRLQTKALRECESFEALMSLAYEIFHLRYQKVVYVIRLKMDLVEAIKRWRDSDKKRLSKETE